MINRIKLIFLSWFKSIFKLNPQTPLNQLISSLRHKKLSPSLFFKKHNCKIDKQITILKSYKAQEALEAKNRVLQNLKKDKFDILSNHSKIIFDIKLQLQLYNEVLGDIEEFKINNPHEIHFNEVSDKFSQSISNDIKSQINHPKFKEAFKYQISYNEFLIREYIQNMGSNVIDIETLFDEFAKINIWTNDNKILLKYMSELQIQIFSHLSKWQNNI